MTNAVRLRALEPEDLDLLYQIENDGSLWEVGCTNVPYSRSLLRDFIVNSTGDIYTDKQLRLMVERPDGAVVGIVDLVNFSPRHLRAEMGIVVVPEARRRGYATEALRLLADYARRILHLRQLYAYVDAGNEASISVLLRAGFQKTAVLKDWLHAADEYRDALFLQYFL